MKTTSFPNKMLQDSRLSYKARGMLAMVLSSDLESEVSRDWLEENGTEGREAISTAMRELEKAGYAVYAHVKDEGGRYYISMWRFYSEPVEEGSRTDVTMWSKAKGSR